jgi:hypothetical protein
MKLTIEHMNLIAALVDTANRTTDLESIYNDSLPPSARGASISWKRAAELLQDFYITSPRSE